MAVQLSIAVRSDVGRVRSRNEDWVASDPQSGVVVVADGMGGHPAGDVASRLAAEEAVRLLASPAEPGADPGADPGAEPAAEPGEGMAEAIRAADHRVRTEARNHPERAGMGTTLTAIRVERATGRFVIGHVGDSRAYRWRDGALERLTRDDTWVQDQVDAGRLTEEQAREHPWSSALSQALGLERPVDPAIVEGRVRPGDLYLLCSDGLSAMLSDGDVEGVLRAVSSGRLAGGLEATADALVSAANDRGGVDNISVGIVAVTPDG